MTYIDCDDAPVIFLARCECSGKYLNLRADKSTKSASLAQISRYEMVEVIDASDKEWWRCRYGGIVGYCMAQYLVKMPDPVPSTPQTTEDDVVSIRREDAYAAIAALEQVCMMMREAVSK